MRIARGAFWSLVGAVAARGLGLLSWVVIARLIGKVHFGELGIIQNTVSLFGTFAGVSLGMTATKFIADFHANDPVRAGRIRALSSMVAWVTSSSAALILFCGADWLAARTLAAPHLGIPLRISAVFLMFTTVNGAQMGSLAGFEAFRTVAKLGVCSGLANFLFMVLGAYCLGLQGVVIGLVLGSMVTWVLYHVAIRKECRRAGVPYAVRGVWEERKTLWRFSLPAVACSGIAITSEWALNTLLARQHDGYAQLGVFNAAKQWQTFILYIPTSISSATFPVLSYLLTSRNLQQYRKALLTNTLLFSASALVVAAPIALGVGPIMHAYGEGFAEGRTVLLVVCAQSVLFAANIVVGQAIWASGAALEAFFFTTLRAVLLVGSFFLLRDRGALGLALAYLVTFFLQTCYILPYAWFKVQSRLGDPATSSTGPADSV